VRSAAYETPFPFDARIKLRRFKETHVRENGKSRTWYVLLLFDAAKDISRCTLMIPNETGKKNFLPKNEYIARPDIKFYAVLVRVRCGAHNKTDGDRRARLKILQMSSYVYDEIIRVACPDNSRRLCPQFMQTRRYRASVYGFGDKLDFGPEKSNFKDPGAATGTCAIIIIIIIIKMLIIIIIQTVFACGRG